MHGPSPLLLPVPTQAEQAYRIAEASLQRLKRLASKFDTRRPATRHNLVESVDTLLQLEAWSSEQSVQVRRGVQDLWRGSG